MRIAAMPFEHAGLLAVAQKWTGDCPEVPVLGVETFTTGTVFAVEPTTNFGMARVINAKATRSGSVFIGDTFYRRLRRWGPPDGRNDDLLCCDIFDDRCSRSGCNKVNISAFFRNYLLTICLS